MSAVYYYLGRRSFTSKAGNPCFLVSLISKSRDGWCGVGRSNSTDKFVDSDIYDLCADIPAGSAVTVDALLGGSIISIDVNTEYKSLPLGVRNKD